MLEEIVKDFKSIVTDYQSYPSEYVIPRDVHERHSKLAAKCVIETMRLLVGYDETVTNLPMSAFLKYLEHIRMDVFEELAKEGIAFHYYYHNGLLYGRLVDQTQVMVMYPVTTVQQTPLVRQFIDGFEIKESTIH